MNIDIYQSPSLEEKKLSGYHEKEVLYMLPLKSFNSYVSWSGSACSFTNLNAKLIIIMDDKPCRSFWLKLAYAATSFVNFASPRLNMIYVQHSKSRKI